MKRIVERILLALFCVALAWFYLWTVRSGAGPWKFGQEQTDYYNLLLDGWLDGHLYMKVDVPEALLKLPDPYDPTLRPAGLGLHDASFYHGKYYLYFGAAPVAVLLLPFRLLTGTDLPQSAAVVGFVGGGFLASLALWLAVRRRYFPETGPFVTLLAAWTLGLSALGPVLLRRPHVWELPIAAGYAFAMLALLCVYHGLHAAGAAGGPDRRRRARWLAGAGLCLGLAIGSRPTYLIASPFLVVPFLYWWWTERRLPWREAWSTLAPLAVIGGVMAWHNYARFGSPLQFGQAYQFSLDYESKMAHFRPGHVPFNLWRYYFSAAEWSASFPFIRPAELPSKPPGFGGHDDVYGLLTNLPIAWIALLAPLALWRRGPAERRPLAAWLATAAVLFAGMAGTLALFFGSLARYQSDFAPVLMLLAVVGVLALERWLRLAVTWPGRWLLRGGWAAAAVFSGGFAVLFSLQLNDFLLEKNPAVHRDVARRLNRVPAAVGRMLGRSHGPLELSVWLQKLPPGTRQLLAIAGPEPKADRLYVRYEAGERIRFEVESAHGVTRLSGEAAPDFTAVHSLRWVTGSLLPPDLYPAFGDAAPGEVRAARHRLALDFDGRRMLDEAPWFAAEPGPVRLGVYASPEGPVHFSGAIMASRRDEAGVAGWAAEAGRRAVELQALTAGGAVRLRFALPENPPAATRDPLLVTGRPGRGDMVAVERIDDRHVRVVLDHWGHALQLSEPVVVEPGEVQEVVVALRPFAAAQVGEAAGGRLEVRWNGRVVWQLTTELYRVEPLEIAIGRNPIGGTSCVGEFSGRILAVEAAR
jgi:hypothetical protein